MKRILLSLIIPAMLSGCNNSPDDQTITLRAVSDIFTLALDRAGQTLDVIQNDRLGNGGGTLITSVSAAQIGTVAISGDGLSLTYDSPVSGAADSFEYTITDALGIESTATVTLTLAVSPLAVADAASTLQNLAVDVAVLANDSTIAPPLSISNIGAATSGTVVQSDNGTAGDTSDDYLVYTPNLDFLGDDSFEYTILDQDGETSTATVTLSVVETPVAVFDLFKGGRGAPLAVSVLTGGPALESYDDSTLSNSLIVDDQGTPNDATDDILRYTGPSDIAVAVETFDYVVNIGGDSVTGVATINLANQTNPDGSNELCDLEIEKRKNSGQGWCYETYMDSHDGGTEADPTAATNIALQVFVPHPWHQRLNALATGVALAGNEVPYSPLLVHSHGFGGSKLEELVLPDGDEPVMDDQVARDAWLDGYNVISYTQRGFGGTQATQGDNVPSEAPIGIMSPNLEGFDFVRVVDWAICHFRAGSDLANALPVDVNTTAADSIHDVENAGTCVGSVLSDSMLLTDDGARLTDYDDDVALATVGYSYGGGFQFLAQSVDPRVDVIIPLGTWHDLRYSLHPNGAPKAFWIEIMNQFSGTTPGLGGGNGTTLPTVLTTARTESNGTNVQNDTPHGKANQVSVDSARILGAKGPVAWCDNNHTEYFKKKYIDGNPNVTDFDDGDQTDGATVCASDGNDDPECQYPVDEDTGAQAGAAPSHYFGGVGDATGRRPRANILMVQGYADTLFNFNEGYDNARCFAEAGVEDVRFLAQVSGHPSPTQAPIPADAIPPSYAGRNLGMYLDEIVHCGVDENNDPVRYNMVEVGKQFMDFHLRGGLLAEGVATSEDIFPTVCVTQTNVDPDYSLDPDDPFYSGTNTEANAFQWSREGVTFDSLADLPVGSNQNTTTATQVLPISATANTAADAAALPADCAAGDAIPLNTGAGLALTPSITMAPVYEASDPNGEVLAGIPLVHLNVTRPNTSADELFFAGTYVKRCHLDPSDTGECEENDPELLHFQVTPIRVFPTPAAQAQAMELPPGSETFPQKAPRNFIGSNTEGAFYPVVFGDNPPNMPRMDGDVPDLRSSFVSPNGRLPGVSARLYPGDEVGIALMPSHYMYLNITTDQPAGQVNVSGCVALPLVSDAPAAPTNEPSYVVVAP